MAPPPTFLAGCRVGVLLYLIVSVVAIDGAAKVEDARAEPAGLQPAYYDDTDADSLSDDASFYTAHDYDDDSSDAGSEAGDEFHSVDNGDEPDEMDKAGYEAKLREWADEVKEHEEVEAEAIRLVQQTVSGLAGIAESDDNLSAEQKEFVARAYATLGQLKADPKAFFRLMDDFESTIAAMNNLEESAETEEEDAETCLAEDDMGTQMLENEGSNISSKVENMLYCMNAFEDRQKGGAEAGAEEPDGNEEDPAMGPVDDDLPLGADAATLSLHKKRQHRLSDAEALEAEREAAEVGLADTASPLVDDIDLLQVAERSSTGIRSRVRSKFWGQGLLTGILDFAKGAPVKSGIPKCPMSYWVNNNIERMTYVWDHYILGDSEGRAHATARVITDLHAWTCPPERHMWTFFFALKEVSLAETLGVGRNSLLGVEVFVGSVAIVWMIMATTKGSAPIARKVREDLLEPKESLLDKLVHKARALVGQEYKKLSIVTRVKNCAARGCQMVENLSVKLDQFGDLRKVTKTFAMVVGVRVAWYFLRLVLPIPMPFN